MASFAGASQSSASSALPPDLLWSCVTLRDSCSSYAHVRAALRSRTAHQLLLLLSPLSTGYNDDLPFTIPSPLSTIDIARRAHLARLQRASLHTSQAPWLHSFLRATVRRQRKTCLILACPFDIMATSLSKDTDFILSTVNAVLVASGYADKCDVSTKTMFASSSHGGVLPHHHLCELPHCSFSAEQTTGDIDMT